MKSVSSAFISLNRKPSVHKTIDQLRSQLTRFHLKWSSQRERIVSTFLLQEHVTVRALYTQLNKGRQRTPLAAVYRTVKVLCQLGIARPRSFMGETHYDNVSAKSEHDHLICTECGRIVEFEDRTIEKLRQKVAVANGFSLTARNLELYGLCRHCRDYGDPSRQAI